MTVKTLCLIGIATAMTMSGCSSIDVESSYDGAADFHSLDSYAWTAKAQSAAAAGGDETLAACVRKAVDNELAAQGFAKRASAQKPSFMVSYKIVLQDKAAVREVNDFYGDSRGSGAPGEAEFGPNVGWRVGGKKGEKWGRSDANTYVYQYEQGSLVLEISDPASDRVIWWGTARTEIAEDPEPARTEKRVCEAVRKLLSSFPPKTPLRPAE